MENDVMGSFYLRILFTFYEISKGMLKVMWSIFEMLKVNFDRDKNCHLIGSNGSQCPLYCLLKGTYRG